MGPWVTARVRGDEGEMYGMATTDVRDERYEVNHCSEREKILNQVERRWKRMECARVSKAADRSRRQRKETCCVELAIERWSWHMLELYLCAAFLEVRHMVEIYICAASFEDQIMLEPYL